jgi:CPA2 family monovalent cation:H+ antiporter-2
MGQSVQTSVRIGMSLAQIGEFSFIIAGVGVVSGKVPQLLYSMAVAVSAITTLLTPWLIRGAPATASWIDRKLPRSLQTFAALYTSWLEQLRSRPAVEIAPMRRATRWLIVDAVVAAAIVIGASVEMDHIVSWAAERWQVTERTTRLAVMIGAAVISAPFWIGLVRVARYLGFELTARVFPAVAREQADLAAAPRRLLLVTLQLAIVLAIGIPLVALTQPFLPPFRGAAVLLFVTALLAFTFWRSATNMQGHTRASAQALADTIARQVRVGHETSIEHSLDDANRILAGLGSPTPVEIPAGNPHVGKTLADIKLRGLTGATVLAIRRGEEAVIIPSGRDRIEAGDILAVAGTQEAVAAAKELLSAKVQ